MSATTTTAPAQWQDIKTEIDSLISQDRVVIFSKENCPYCVDAKNVFQEMGQMYSEVELNNHPKSGQVQAVLKEMTGAGTVPRVFVHGKCIGGGSDTKLLFETGQLEQILKPDSSPPAKPTSGGENPAEQFHFYF